LVTLSIGSDVGLARNHTLDIYRLNPDPKYIGRLRIVDVRPTGSVGRVINQPGMLTPVVQVGDTVGLLQTEAEPRGGQPGASNPPPALLKGSVKKIDTDDPRRIVISLGKAQGLDVGHTLEVFRTRPEAKYLGMVRVISVQNDNAVAELVGPTAGKVKLLEGDQVWSQLSK